MVLGTGGIGVIENGGESVAGRFRKFHVALDDHAEHEFLEMALHLVIDLTGEVEAAVIHRQQETFNFKGGVGFPFDNADGVEKFGNAFQCKIFALNRNDDGVRCGKRIDQILLWLQHTAFLKAHSLCCRR